ncbi:MAG: hypothetical protein ACPGF7_13295 [Pontibacterium sp.]
MEFFAVFLVTLIILIGLVTALTFGRSPGYRPSRTDTLKLLRAVQSDKARPEDWYLFLSMPVLHDPELEQIRQFCVLLDEGDGERKPAAQGLVIYARAERESVAKIADTLEMLIKKEPACRAF